MDHQVHGRFAVCGWRYDDAVDQRAQSLDEGLAVLGIEKALEIFDGAAIHVSRTGVQGERDFLAIDLGQLLSELGLFGFHGGEALHQGGRGRALDDLVDDAIDAAREFGQAFLERSAILALRLDALAQFFVEGLDEARQRFGRHQIVAQRCQDARFDVLPLDAAAIGAIAALAEAGAAEPVAADNGIAGAAAAAFCQAGQQVLGP